MKLGDTFLMDASSASRYIKHLHIAISDPAKHGGKFIVVNITSDRFRAGEECVLDVGDHPFIKKKSFVSFADALEISAARIEKLVKSKKAILKGSVNHAVLNKIVTAAKASNAIPENFKKYL